MDVKPSLLHGDLWSGNVGETDDGPGNVCVRELPPPLSCGGGGGG